MVEAYLHSRFSAFYIGHVILLRPTDQQTMQWITAMHWDPLAKISGKTPTLHNSAARILMRVRMRKHISPILHLQTPEGTSHFTDLNTIAPVLLIPTISTPQGPGLLPSLTM